MRPPDVCRAPTTQALRRALWAGGMVGMVADQRPSRSGVAATFLGQGVEFSPGLATLHDETGCPVWFAALLLETSPVHTVGPAP